MFVAECLNCGKDIETQANPKYRKKFCNHSCSAKYSNKRRDPMSEEQKAKIRKTVKETYALKEKRKRYCVMCNGVNNRSGKTCSEECHKKLRVYYTSLKKPRIRPNYNKSSLAQIERRYKIHCFKCEKNKREPLTFEEFKEQTFKRDNHIKIKRITKVKKERICIECNEIFYSKDRLTCSNGCLYKQRERNCGHARKFKVVDSAGKECTLGSPWEKIVYDYLIENKIYWTRPKYITWYSESKQKACKYFADFYLPNYNLYLDPKNSYVQKLQQEKLEVLVNIINLIYGKPEYIISKLKELIGRPTQIRTETTR